MSTKPCPAAIQSDGNASRHQGFEPSRIGGGAAKLIAWAYPVEPEELDAQQHRVGSAAAAGVEALKKLTPPSPPEQSRLTPATPAKPLPPLSTVWPSAPPRQIEPSQSSAVPIPAPIAAAPPKGSHRPTPAVAAPAQKPTVSKEVTVTFALSKGWRDARLTLW